jgi:BirA family biotin operon repressor/biotin-[acetyl-CoA-carboxylase] ligase
VGADERRIIWLDSTDSTMKEAERLAAGGCPSGAVVGAEEQTAGIGRFERRWHSQKGAGLYFTVVLRLNLPFEDLPVVTMALGLAVAEAIHAVVKLVPDLRWPNDVLLGGKKCCGILVQLHGSAVLAGIGINVNEESFPAELAAIATSLRIVSGREQDRQVLLHAVLGCVDEWIARLCALGRVPVLDAFARASSYVLGKAVTVEQEQGKLLRGITTGLDENGFLKVRSADGRIHVILAGGVRPDYLNASRP